MNNNLRRGLAAGAVLAATAAVGVLGAGPALANPTDQLCQAGQLDTTLVPGSPGAGQRYASVQFTAKPGNSCKLVGPLPVSLQGAPGVAVIVDDSAAQPVYVTAGKPAHVLLHWTGIGAPEEQQTPDSITVGFVGKGGGATKLVWNQGPVDASVESHTLDVGPVLAGPAES